MRNLMLALLTFGLNACDSQPSTVSAQTSEVSTVNHEFAVVSQPMHVFLGRILKIDPTGVASSGGPASVTYAVGCTEHFETLITRDMPSIDPSEKHHIAVGAIMSGSKCSDCLCPVATGQALLNFVQPDVAQSFDIITPAGEDQGDLYPAEIVDIAQQPADDNQLNVTVTYLEKCFETLIDVVPAEVAPIGGYHRNVAVLALVKKNNKPCSMPSHPMTKYFKYPSNVGGYHFLPVD